MKNKTLLLLGIAVLVVGGGAWYVLAGPGAVVQDPVVTEEPGAKEVPTKVGTGSAPAVSGSAPEQPAEPMTTFAKPEFGFAFEYPNAMTLETSGIKPAAFKDGAIAVVAVYARFDTVVDRLTVSVSSEPSDVGSCMRAPVAQTTSATIGGVPFLRYVIESTSGAQTITSTIYRVVRGTYCYEMRDVLTKTTPDRLPLGDIHQQEANEAAIAVLMGSIIDSFRFTN